MQNIVNELFSIRNEMRNVEAFNKAKDKDYWAEALVEELGEMLGAAKKLKRGFTPRDYKRYIDKHPDLKEITDEAVRRDVAAKCWFNEQSEKLSKEWADLFIYMDLYATHQGINKDRALFEKFNEVSNEMESKVFLPEGWTNRAPYSKHTIDQ